jgi:hypothetical protein
MGAGRDTSGLVLTSADHYPLTPAAGEARGYSLGVQLSMEPGGLNIRQNDAKEKFGLASLALIPHINFGPQFSKTTNLDRSQRGISNSTLP